MKRTIVIGMILCMSIVLIVGCTPSKPSVPSGQEVDLKVIHEKVKAELGEDYVANMVLEKRDIAGILELEEKDIQEFIAEMPMMSTHVDTFFAIKATEGKTSIVEEQMQKYRNNLVENSMQYPMNIAKVNASEIIKQGDYVFFVMLGKFDDRQDVSEDDALKFAKEETQKIKELILKNFN